MGGVQRPLEGLSAQALQDWLHHRRQRWPLTANPHLLVSEVSALTTSPVSTTLLVSLFAGTGVSLDRMRMDRYL